MKHKSTSGRSTVLSTQGILKCIQVRRDACVVLAKVACSLQRSGKEALDADADITDNLDKELLLSVGQVSEASLHNLLQTAESTS
jgi:hypothetical protein